jgi:hypothetical protein
MEKVTSADDTATASKQSRLSYDRYCAEIVAQTDLLS